MNNEIYEKLQKLGKCKDGTDNHDYEYIKDSFKGLFTVIGGPKKFKCKLCGKEKLE